MSHITINKDTKIGEEEIELAATFFYHPANGYKQKEMNRNLLALDVASKTGWATKTASGTWDLNPKKDESKGMALIRFKAKLTEIVKLEGVNIIVFERPAGMHVSSVISQSEKHGVLKLFCEENSIEYKAYSASEIKRFATGKGNAGKPAMIASCYHNYGIQPLDDNHADALHIYHLAIKDLHL